MDAAIRRHWASNGRKVDWETEVSARAGHDGRGGVRIGQEGCGNSSSEQPLYQGNVNIISQKKLQDETSMNGGRMHLSGAADYTILLHISKTNDETIRTVLASD
jgi:hypothetical protein